jgi:hypothetical protein
VLARKLDALLDKLGVKVLPRTSVRLQPLDEATALAPGWVEKFSNTYGVPFFFNPSTKKSSWLRPAIGQDGDVVFVDNQDMTGNN